MREFYNKFEARASRFTWYGIDAGENPHRAPLLLAVPRGEEQIYEGPFFCPITVAAGASNPHDLTLRRWGVVAGLTGAETVQVVLAQTGSIGNPYRANIRAQIERIIQQSKESNHDTQ